ncbi:hypothetical protein ACTFIU_000738 [Dictyostelium citrinum]
MLERQNKKEINKRINETSNEWCSNGKLQQNEKPQQQSLQEEPSKPISLPQTQPKPYPPSQQQPIPSQDGFNLQSQQYYLQMPPQQQQFNHPSSPNHHNQQQQPINNLAPYSNQFSPSSKVLIVENHII